MTVELFKRGAGKASFLLGPCVWPNASSGTAYLLFWGLLAYSIVKWEEGKIMTPGFLISKLVAGPGDSSKGCSFELFNQLSLGVGPK